jgi:hypothetical protein
MSRKGGNRPFVRFQNGLNRSRSGHSCHILSVRCMSEDLQSVRGSEGARRLLPGEGRARREATGMQVVHGSPSQAVVPTESSAPDRTRQGVAVGESRGLKAWREKNRDRRLEQPREIHLRNKFGLMPVQYDRILETQGGVCALCGCPRTRGSRCTSITITGRVRSADSCACAATTRLVCSAKIPICSSAPPGT